MKKQILFLLLIAALPALAQNVRIDRDFPSISNTTATPYLIANVPPNSPTLAVCNYPANNGPGLPCTNYATTYDSTGAACPNGAQDTPQPQPSACQSTGDAQGNIGFWVAPGANGALVQYDFTVTVKNVTYGPFTITVGNGTGSSGGSATANVYTSTLPTPSTQGLLGLLYPPTGLKNFSLYNGANWFNTSPYDSDARIWGCDNTGATDAAACLSSILTALPVTSGQSIRIPRGTYLINSVLHVSREAEIDCDGGMADYPGTLLQLGPGANIVFDGINTSPDGGTGQWSTFKGCKIKGTALTCTASSASSTLSACSANPATVLGLTANDYLVVMGFNTTALWGVTVPQGTQVSSTTSNSITLAGGVLPIASGTVTVMKSGYIAATGISANGSAVITAISPDKGFTPGDVIQGPGIPFPAYVNSINTVAHTVTMNVTAGAAAGVGSFTKGPLPNLTMRGGSVVVEDDAFDLCAGSCYDVVSGTGVVADGQYANRNRITHAGDACVHYRGSDANTSTDIGFQMTYCANGGIFDESFLGNTHIGMQVASSGGIPYHATGANASIIWINPYIEGGQATPVYSPTNLVICGLNNTNLNNNLGGNLLGCNGSLSPTFFWKSDINGSTATMAIGSPNLTNVTNISHFPVGTSVVGTAIPANTTVTANDGVSALTLSKNALAKGDLESITSTRTAGYAGSPSSSNGMFGFGTSVDGSTETDYILEFQNPPNFVGAATSEIGDFTWTYRGSPQPFGFTSNQSTMAWDFNGANNMDAWPVFYRGLRIGSLASKFDFRANASAAAPTTGQWARGSLAVSTSGLGMWQQSTASKSVSGHADITAGSKALINQDATFLGGCAPADSITGTGIQSATVLTDQNTLSREATATTATLAVTCTRVPKAHSTTTCDTHTNTTVDNCSTASGWAVNDTIRGTGIPAGTFITAIVGTTFTISQAATATNSGIAVTDAAWTKLATTLASGTAALGTSSISATSCASVVTVAATGAASTDAISWAFNAAPSTGYISGLNVLAYVTANNVNFLVCNPTAGSLTPAAATLNWRIGQ